MVTENYADFADLVGQRLANGEACPPSSSSSFRFPSTSPDVGIDGLLQTSSRTRAFTGLDLIAVA